MIRDSKVMKDYPTTEYFVPPSTNQYLPANGFKKGEVQRMVFQIGDIYFKKNSLEMVPWDLVGKAKGLWQILAERGLVTFGQSLKKDDLIAILAKEPDFKAESSLLKKLRKDSGYKCVFLPKMHPELNPIERVWSRLKYFCRLNCKYTIGSLRDNIPKGSFPHSSQSQQPVESVF
eukprot:TRINITY_DN1838_c0_g1_i1.p1 TRINITY_DN1838_c0_g1~~TRINITY_DN1838_c0_g1_i1.p1  ORF type:complete len:175 (+),score=38.22 TRINITY_DN1838_c0_g1_i1:849-1373(+)